MDSGNSSSMQSSSGGGEEEYDSRADHSISAFFNHHNSTSSAARSMILHHDHGHGHHIRGSLPDLPPPPPPHHQPHLDPIIATYFNNLDTVWSSKPIRPGPDLTGPADSQQPLEPVLFTNPTSLPYLIPNSSGSVLPSGGDRNKNGDNNNNNNSSSNNSTVRNPKKRSRASRRAPTTVLTTDTTNFRAMVQEFTGIPAPTFTGSSPFSRTGRFDLFGSSPNYSFPLRPLPQKLNPPSFLSSSPSSSSGTIFSSCSSSPSLSSYYLPSAEHQNLLSMTTTQTIASPFLNIHVPKSPSTDPSNFSTKPKPLLYQSQNMKVGNGLDDQFGHFGGLQSIVSSSSTSTLMHINKTSEAQDMGADLLRSINGGFGEPVHRAATYRGNAAAAASGSLSAPEINLAAAAAAKNEGMVESWMCSSD